MGLEVQRTDNANKQEKIIEDALNKRHAWLIEQIKAVRLKADRLIKMAYIIKCSPETTLAWRSLQMAKAWLGKALEDMGDRTPYTVADKVEDIPPTAEAHEGTFELSTVHLDNVNTARADIQALVNEISVLPAMPGAEKSIDDALRRLVEARFNYGFELASIHETQTKKD